MKTLIALIVTVASTVAFARAGTLLRCDFIVTSEGGRYVGTYCVDYECKYTERYVFTSYCPFAKP